jgi:hypothetical protein
MTRALVPRQVYGYFTTGLHAPAAARLLALGLVAAPVPLALALALLSQSASTTPEARALTALG